MKGDLKSKSREEIDVPRDVSQRELILHSKSVTCSKNMQKNLTRSHCQRISLRGRISLLGGSRRKMKLRASRKLEE